MSTLTLTLTLDGLSKHTHVWFPSGDFCVDYSVLPTERMTDRFGNHIAYFLLHDRHVQIEASYDVAARMANAPKVSRRDVKMFAQPSDSIQSTNPAIRNLARRLTTHSDTDGEKARHIFDWVASYLEYANPIAGLYSSVQALTDRRVDCGGFSTLMVALLRSLDIPARCVFGWAIESIHGYHAWMEFYDRQRKQWIPADPAVAHLGKRTKLQAGFGFISDPRVVLSVGEEFVLEGHNKFRYQVPLLQCPVVVSVNSEGLFQPFQQDLSWRVQR